MSAKTAGTVSEGSHWEPKYPFDLVVAYEDTPTRERAIVLYDHLAQQLLDEYDFQCSWWKFDHLREPALREQSIDAAAEANMIILSLRDSRELPPLAKNWIETWRGRKADSKSALVVLVDEAVAPAHEFGPVLAHLQKIAHAANMDFFSPALALAEPAMKISAESIQERAGKVTSILDEILQRRPSPPQWGINE